MFTSCSPVASQALKGALAANSKKRSPCLNFKTSEEKCRLEDDAEDNYSMDTIERKIRRLTTEQVTSLERKFEIENKLEPELKLQLSKELGLQPRQVAIWFQNRRARWKTKQMEKDYDNLKAKYDALKCDHALLLQDKKKLLDQVLRLNEKLQNADGVDSGIENLGSDTKRVQAGLTLKAEVLVERSMEDERPGNWNLNSTPNKKGLEDQKEYLTHIENFPLKNKQDRSWSSYRDNSEIVYVDCSRSNKSTHSMAEHMSFSESTGQESATEQTSIMHFGEDNYLCTVRNLSLAYQISAIKSEDIIYQDGYNNHFAVLEDQFPAWWDWP